MTISSTPRTAGPFAGNGVAAQFPFAYKVFSRADVLVAKTVTATGVESILTLDSDYTVTLNSDQNSSPGGVILLTVPLAAGTSLAATSNLSIQQSLDLTNNGGFFPTVINNALDRIVINIQQLAARVGTGALNVGAAANIAGILNALTNLAGATGATLLGWVQTGAGAISTTIAEVFSRKVSVWDFMSPALRADALSGAPVLDHAPAWNAAIASLGGAGRVTVERKRTAVFLLKSTVFMGTSNTVDSAVVIDADPGTLVKATLPNITDVLFSVKNVPGHFNYQGIRNLKVQSTNGNGVGIKFNGQCFGSFENLYLEGFNVGRWFSNEGNAVYNEFIRFNNLELHLCHTGTLMSKDGDVGGTDTSMHGLSDRNVTVNVGPGQVGLQMVDVCWYNGDADIKFFSQPTSEAVIKMSTSGVTSFKGAFISGSITCEGSANMIGVGRFYLAGNATFLSGVTDTLISPDAWEQGFMANNYLKSVAYGGTGMTVSELSPKSGSQGTIGPVGSFVQLVKANVQALLANSYTSHAGAPGNGLYTGYTGYHTNYGAGNLGCFLASDGTEYGTYAPTSTQCAIKHNTQFILRYDGVARTNNTEGFLMGSGGAGVYSGTGSPEGVLAASIGSTYARRDGGALTASYVKESGSGNTGWVAK